MLLPLNGYWLFYALEFFFCPASAQTTALSRIVDSLHNSIKTEGDDSNKVNTINLLSIKLCNAGKYDSSLVYTFKAHELSGKIAYKKGDAEALTNISLDYLYLGSYPEALKYTVQARALEEETENRKGLAYCYNLTGNIYYEKGDYSKALEFYSKALKLNKDLNNKNGIANNFGNIGNINRIQGNYPVALECYRRSLDLHREVANKLGEANNLGNIGNTYEAEGDYANAKDYYLNVLKIARVNGFKNNTEANMGDLGDLYTKLKDFNLAKIYLDSSLNIAQAIREKDDIKKDYSYLARLDSAMDDYKGALTNYKAYVIYRDSLVNAANARTEINFEIEQKQAAQKAEQEKKDAVAAQERKKQIVVRNTFIVGLILILLVVLLLYSRYKTKAKTTKLLEEQNQVINERNAELDRLSIVARETGNFVFILDSAGKVEWANESFTRINNITLEELKKQKGETIYELSNTPDIRNIIETAVREKKTMVYESHIHDKDGKSIWGSSTLTPTFDEAGNLKKMIIVDTDITERKKDEEIIKEKNKDITDSIRYAKRLQDATMLPIKQIKNFLPDFFVLYKPKDIVAGDFYWIKKQGETIFVAAADCTGHGVPGSLVSIVCSNALNRAIKEFGLTETGLILDKTRELVVETFSHGDAFGEKSQSNVQDGMDISLIAIQAPLPPKRGNSLATMDPPLEGREAVIQWSGANNPLWYIKDGKLNEITADKQPIGKYYNTKPFTTHTTTLTKGDTVYLFTDGYADQFGGNKGKKFKHKQLQDVIQSINGLSMDLQKEKLDTVFEEWKGNLEQVDDVCIFGIRI